jgi:hypothetical protein
MLLRRWMAALRGPTKYRKLDMSTTRDPVIDVRNASGPGEALAGIDLTADAGRVLARPGPAALASPPWCGTPPC